MFVINHTNTAVTVTFHKPSPLSPNSPAISSSAANTTITGSSDSSNIQNITFGVFATLLAFLAVFIAYLQLRRTVNSYHLEAMAANIGGGLELEEQRCVSFGVDMRQLYNALAYLEHCADCYVLQS